MVQRFHKFLRRSQEGFTLIELLVVVAILGILAVAVTPKVLSSIRNANTAAAMTSASTLQLALERYATDFGDYPSTVAANTYAGLQTVLNNYVALPAAQTNNNWKYVSYTYTAGSPSSFTLVLTDTNQTPVTITVTPGSIVHS